MKRLFPTSLVLLLVMASFGHVLAAAFCPLALGCCFAKTVNHNHSPSSSQVNKAAVDMDMEGMSVVGMNMDEMATAGTCMNHKAMHDPMIDSATVDISVRSSPPVFTEEALADKFDQPAKSCPHCLGHSGVVNAPVSFVSVSDQSGKEIGSVLLPVARFLLRPSPAPAQLGLPNEHAPPDSSAPRYILISVFLI